MSTLTCSVDGCSKRPRGRGWCGAHYQMWRRHGNPLTQPRGYVRGVPIGERFWSKVDQHGAGECWEWTAGVFRDRMGYGKFQAGTFTDSKVVYAHRFAWELTNGPVPDGLLVLHHCDNPPCCNPAHLFLGTYRDNALDMVSKGRHWRHR